MRLRASLDALRRGVSDTVVDPRPRSLQLRLLHTRMSRTLKQSQVLVYQDVLCPWSWLAELRLSQLQRELAEVMRFVPRPYPLRPMESLPSEDEIARAVKDLEAAARERESLPLRSELWTSGDPPRSSMEPLAALEAARLQGEPARLELQRRLRHAALEQGLNVSRPDIVLELAEQADLQMNRFTAAFGSSQTRRLIREEYRLARGRGVRLSLIHISEPTRLLSISYAVFCLKKKK